MATRRAPHPDDAELASQLARLWPHREHESSSLKALFCTCGVHYWRRLDLSELVPGRDVQYCFWCSLVKIDGVAHDP